MNYKDENVVKSNIIIYTTEDGLSKIETTFDGDTVWLTKAQMAELFQRDRSVISKHIKNIFEEGELTKVGNVQIMLIQFNFENLPIMRFFLFQKRGGI